MSTPSDFIIVGAGVFGASTALALARSGHSVTVLERSADGFVASDGASHDHNKIIRADYSDQNYSDLAKRAISEWRRDPLYSPFYHEVGLLLHSGLLPSNASPSTLDSAMAYVSNGIATAGLSSSKGLERPADGKQLPKIAYQLESKSQAVDAFPASARAHLGNVVEGYGEGDEASVGKQFAYINPRAGWAEAFNATYACLGEARHHGAKVLGDCEVQALILSKTSPSSRKPKVVGVRTKHGQEIMLKDQINGAVILACGSWSKELLSKVIPSSVSTTIDANQVAVPSAQCVLTLKVPEELRKRYKDTPVCLNFSTGFYLFEPRCSSTDAEGDVEGVMKIAIHAEGYTSPLPPLGIQSSAICPPPFPEQSSDATNTKPNSRASIPATKTQEMMEQLGQVYPELAKLEVLSTRVCWYSDSKDENWIIDFHPEVEGLLVATGDAGHAFKFLPILGQLLCSRLSLPGAEPLTAHQDRVWSFGHHVGLLKEKVVEFADSGRAKTGAGAEAMENLRARI